MGLSIRDSRLRRVEARLRQVGMASAAVAADSETASAIEREVLAYELNASALLVERRGYDFFETAEGCRERLAGLNSEQREAVFELARKVFKPLAGCSATDERRVLEALIEATRRDPLGGQVPVRS